MSLLKRPSVDEHGDTVLEDEVVVVEGRMPLGELSSRLAVLAEGYLPPEHGSGWVEYERGERKQRKREAGDRERGEGGEVSKRSVMASEVKWMPG